MLSLRPFPVSSRLQRRRALGPALLACVAGWTAAPAHAQVYASAPADDAAAPLVLSNFASEDTPRLLIDAPPAAPKATPPADATLPATAPLDTTAPAAPRIAGAPGVPAGLLPWFQHVGREHALPVSLLLAVAAVESGFNPRARSPKGAQGLMQLMPDTARQLGVRQVWSVGDNLRGGASYLRALLQRFSGDLPLALAAYNAGEGAVQRAGNRIPDFEETRLYVPKVMAWQRHYAARHDAPAPRSAALLADAKGKHSP
ncbi:lytic transglycosylase domain-containing protein [Leptothrix discophora]|uniref:Lytic transglycosylase domain-containing protein n=1 Tax=Leptothrix discophora TaxID=89 RepID=A0ABT9G224_LEPDI|nr:lytic transglycosylase domain-containing protein [Leptothrix discophora]MDP4300539.1 lytic transglycosylase domain-containing protein [Leptothrix discophora]